AVEDQGQLLHRRHARLGGLGPAAGGESLADLLVVIQRQRQPVAGLAAGAGVGCRLQALLLGRQRGDFREDLVDDGHGRAPGLDGWDLPAQQARARPVPPAAWGTSVAARGGAPPSAPATPCPMELGTLITLGLYFALMLGIGFWSFRESTDDVAGYMLGGRRLGPAVTALSAGASDMSGWLLMGLPGAMFLTGLSSAWTGLGLFIGAYANYLIVAPRLRVYTAAARDAITLPDYFDKRFEDRSRLLRVVSALVIVVFFTLYTSSGVVAGGKLFEASFGLDYVWGLWITAGVVLAYTMVGGFMAVSLTDFVQGCIMFAALVLVPVVALTQVGGPGGMTETIRELDPAKLDLMRDASVIGVVSALAWGLGYFGQPHIIVRFMAIRSVRDIPTARRIGMSWMGVSLLGALATGLVGFAYA